MKQLVAAFASAKQALTEEIRRCALAGEWTKTQRYAQFASNLDQMISGLHLSGPTEGAAPALRVGVQSPERSVPNSRNKPLPYHFVSGNSLSKLGPSRDGSTYQHNVVRSHYDQILSALVALSKSRREFETYELVQRCDVPGHEPLIVLAVFEQAELLTKYRRGRYAFVEASSFEDAASKVWDNLPRN